VGARIQNGKELTFQLVTASCVSWATFLYPSLYFFTYEMEPQPQPQSLQAIMKLHQREIQTMPVEHQAPGSDPQIRMSFTQDVRKLYDMTSSETSYKYI
jgi:hypothetical protein